MILEFLKIAANLKTIPRQGWIDKISMKNPESVADHTYSMAIMGMIFADIQKYNTERIMKMILLHDLAESITGDFTPDQKLQKEKMILENTTLEKILKNLPKNLQKNYSDIWNEYQRNNSKEANFVHQVDKLEMALQAKIYSKKNKSKKIFKTFYESAQREIKDPVLLKLFNQITDK